MNGLASMPVARDDHRPPVGHAGAVRVGCDCWLADPPAAALQADMYSFGVVLWELVTHDTPIRGRLHDAQVRAKAPPDNQPCGSGVDMLCSQSALAEYDAVPVIIGDVQHEIVLLR